MKATPDYLRELATNARYVGHNRYFLADALEEAANEIEALKSELKERELTITHLDNARRHDEN